MQTSLSAEEMKLIENYRAARDRDRRRISNQTREAAEVAELLIKKLPQEAVV